MTPLLELDDAHYAWPGGPACLSGIDLRLGAGEKVVLLGANGGGKSTLLKLMNGLFPPQRGELRWRGQRVDAGRLRERGFARDFRRHCALLFQHPEAMLFNPSVLDEIAYGPRQLGLPAAEHRARHWAEALGLTETLTLSPFTLSGGQKQKLALACLLANDPELLLLDEPAASLDPTTVGWMIDHLLDSPATVLTCTHNLDLAAELGERALVLGQQGRLLYDGPTAHALSDARLLAAAGLAVRRRRTPRA